MTKIKSRLLITVLLAISAISGIQCNEPKFGKMTPDKRNKQIVKASVKDGASVSVEVVSQVDGIFNLNGKGFKPNESMTFVSKSYHEVLSNPIKADENGELPTIGFMPAVIGKSGGVCHVEFVRKDDTIRVDVPWGIESLAKPVSSTKGRTPAKDRQHIVVKRAKDGASVGVDVISKEDWIFELYGIGFKPNESMNLVCTSFNEVRRSSIKADGKGKIPDVEFMPKVIGKSEGVCQIDIMRKGEIIHVDIPWGIETLANQIGSGNGLVSETSSKKIRFAPLQGAILNGRYTASKNIFSCQADDFGNGDYIAQDVVLDQVACVGFYNPIGNSKEANVFLFSDLKNPHDFKKAFENFGIGMLKDWDKAEGIEVLSQEMIDDMLFSTVSIQKMPYLKAWNGTDVSSTKSYLIFEDKGKLVVLSNQIVTPRGENHTPRQHIETLKKEILEFRKTFEVGDADDIALAVKR